MQHLHHRNVGRGFRRGEGIEIDGGGGFVFAVRCLVEQRTYCKIALRALLLKLEQGAEQGKIAISLWRALPVIHQRPQGEDSALLRLCPLLGGKERRRCEEQKKCRYGSESSAHAGI